jgi:hypothetical protein
VKAAWTAWQRAPVILPGRRLAGLVAHTDAAWGAVRTGVDFEDLERVPDWFAGGPLPAAHVTGYGFALLARCGVPGRGLGASETRARVDAMNGRDLFIRG